jgi:UDP-glucose 4-epimerase
MFDPFVMVGVSGCRPMLQFVHEDDLVNVIGLCISQGKGGIYNVGGDGIVEYGEVARRLRKKLLKLPGGLLATAISLSWKTHLQSAAPAGCLEFLKYPPVVSADKLKRELGYAFRYSSREAFNIFAECYCRAQGNKETDPPSKPVMQTGGWW